MALNITGEDALRILNAIDSGAWKLTRSAPSESLTDEANAKFAWYVERADTPYCTKKGESRWFGSDPLKALIAAELAMEPMIERYRREQESIRRDNASVSS